MVDESADEAVHSSGWVEFMLNPDVDPDSTRVESENEIFSRVDTGVTSCTSSLLEIVTGCVDGGVEVGGTEGWTEQRKEASASSRMVIGGNPRVLRFLFITSTAKIRTALVPEK